jgi:hypothetical protein
VPGKPEPPLHGSPTAAIASGDILLVRAIGARPPGIAPDRLAGLLSGDWRRFSLEALAAAVRGYSISLEALLAPAAAGARALNPELEQ